MVSLQFHRWCLEMLLGSSTIQAGNVPDSTEADCHCPHCGCAEQIQDRVGALRTRHLFLHGLLQHLCIKRDFSQSKFI